MTSAFKAQAELILNRNGWMNMQQVCVITGGGSGIGLATAKLIGQENQYIVIAGRTLSKLQEAVRELQAEGIQAEAVVCDIASAEEVRRLAAYARSIGPIASVIHAAGMSPHMGNPLEIMTANAIGTLHVHAAFYDVLEKGSCLVDVASMAGHLIPRFILPIRKYRLANVNEELFLRKMMARVNLFPARLRSEVAYGISKHFVIHYAEREAARFGAKGIRVLSVSPGSFDTPMGEVEKETASLYTKYCAIPRFGRVEEAAYLLAFCAGNKVAYLTGTDILCDGGCVASGFNPLRDRAKA